MIRKVLDLSRRHFVVFLLCALSPGSLTLYQATAAPLQTDQEKEKIPLLQKALPEAERFERVNRGGFQYVGYRGKERVGAVLYTQGRGYLGPMEVMVGIDSQGKVVEVLLLSHSETPTLWTREADEGFRAQFRGKSGPFILKKEGPAGNLDGVAAATYSCRGIIDAVDEALRIFKKEWGE